jgi:predicted SprT family Zn-dependent metalloprotease
MAKLKVRYPCKCNKNDPEHTKEDSGEGWTRYVCSSCGKVKFAWRADGAKNLDEH